MTRLVVALLCLVLVAAPLAGEAQQAGRLPRVGLLLAGPADPQIVRFVTEPFQDLRWVDGQNIDFLYRWAAEGQEQERLIAELLQRGVDLLFVGGTPAALAARRATSEIPIVFYGVGDPVGTGLVASLAHPGGNVTGVSDIFGELSGKHVELLKEAAPKVSRFAYLWHTTFVDGPRRLEVAQAAAQRLRVSLIPVGVQGEADLSGRLPRWHRQGPAGWWSSRVRSPSRVARRSRSWPRSPGYPPSSDGARVAPCCRTARIDPTSIGAPSPSPIESSEGPNPPISRSSDPLGSR